MGRTIKAFSRFLAVLALALVLRVSVSPAAYAYTDYPTTTNASAVGAAYDFIRSRNSGLPAADDSNAVGFFENVAFAPSSPLYRFSINYVYYRINGIATDGAFGAVWRVLDGGDMSDSDATDTYWEIYDAAEEFLLDEWEKWVEDYPAADAGSSSGGAVADLPISAYVINCDRPITDGEVFTFPDGVTATANSNFATYYNAALSAGLPVLGYELNSNGSGTLTLTTAKCFASSSSFTSPPSNFLGIGFSASSQTNSICVFAPLFSASSVRYWYRNNANYTSDLSSDRTTPYYQLVPFAGSPNGYSAPLYMVCTSSCYNASPAPSGPTGPTAPDYETPETYQPTDTSPVIITNTVQDTSHGVTGSEVDYSDYLKIIIRNQQEQIQQLSDFSDDFVNTVNSFQNWLNTELDNIQGYLTNFQQFWNKTLDWQKSITNYLYSIDQQIMRFRNEVASNVSSVIGLLQQIYQKIPSGNTGGTSRPNVDLDVQDPFDITDPLWDWLSDFFGKLIDSITAWVAGGVATASQSFSGLSGVFPFSVIWDMAAMLLLLVAEPAAPVFDLPLPYTADDTALVHVDLSPWTETVETLHPMFMLLFALALIYLTFDVLFVMMRWLDAGSTE